MRNSESVDLLKHYELLPLEDGMKLVMRDERGLELTQTVRYSAADDTLSRRSTRRWKRNP